MSHNSPIPPANKAPVLSVSQLNQRARQLLEDIFAQVVVEGEISNLARPASGHLYFTLKDSNAQVRCAFFRHNAVRCRQQLSNGVMVKATGKVSLYEGRGDFQLIIEQIEAAGEGALRAAYEALKLKLQNEGLFASVRKQKLPTFPQRIAVVTSPTGAVIRDIISVFERRAPQVQLVLVPTSVQGKEATEQIINALQLAERGNFDAIILARGGGSLEDLWCFNEESLARIIANCQTPIVSAIGHETDISISDFVADVRAPTPTAAAELLAPERIALLERIAFLQQQLLRRMQQQIYARQQGVNAFQARLRHPRERLEQITLRLDELSHRLTLAIEQEFGSCQQQLMLAHSKLQAQHPGRELHRNQQGLQQLQQQLKRAMHELLQHKKHQTQHAMHSLNLVSPLQVLERGYSILLDQHSKVIRNSNQLQAGDKLQAKLASGSLELQVTEAIPATISNNI